MASLPSSVYIREVGPREGLQTSRAIVPLASKLDLIAALNQTGVKEIEITSFVRPEKVPQMADADELVRQYERVEGIKYTALYLNQRGFERGEASGRLDNQGWISIATSDSFLRKNGNTDLAAILDRVPSWLTAFGAAGKSLHGVLVSTAFGCIWEGRTSTSNLIAAIDRVLKRVDECGGTVREINLADTVGWATPDQVRHAVGAVRDAWPACTISLHLHDTRGMGIANAYAGLLEGVTIFDSSVGGMGGCPFAPGAAGNIATEDLVYLCEGLGVATGVNLQALVRAAKLAEHLLGAPLGGKLYRGFSR